MTQNIKFVASLFIIIGSIFFVVLPGHAATSVQLQGPVTASVGEPIELTVAVASDKFINAAEGFVRVEGGRITSVTAAESLFKFWIISPVVHEGDVQFSGGTERPFAGSDGKIFTVEVIPESIGTTRIFFTDARVLLADGKGTDALSTFADYFITVTEAEGSPESLSTDDVVEPSRPHAGDEGGSIVTDSTTNPVRPSDTHGESIENLDSRSLDTKKPQYVVEIAAITTTASVDRTVIAIVIVHLILLGMLFLWLRWRHERYKHKRH